MAHNFYSANRQQPMLLPPSLLDWVDESDLSLFLIDAVAQFDCSALYDKYRDDGRGQTAYEPEMMLTLLIFAYCQGERSSRRIEFLTHRDIGYRVIAANRHPDHSSIARFRKNNLAEFTNVFTAVLRLCHEAGMLKLGTVALDGTKIGANAALEANRTMTAIDKEVAKILGEAETVDAQEDTRYGTRSGYELPDDLQTQASRLARLKECRKRLQEQSDAERQAQAEKIAVRQAAEEASGEKLRGRKPKDPDELATDEAKKNVTDPDSGIMKSRQGYLQGYNAQAMATNEQIIISADVVTAANDIQQLVPQLQKTEEELLRAGIEEEIDKVLVDAGYPTENNITKAEKHCGELIAATTKEWKMRKQDGPPRGRIPNEAGMLDRMSRKLRTKRGRDLYRKRKTIIEPIFGQIKDGRRIRRFMMRGIEAARAEWNLICATHNLLKMYRAAKPVLA